MFVIFLQKARGLGSFLSLPLTQPSLVYMKQCLMQSVFSHATLRITVVNMIFRVDSFA